MSPIRARQAMAHLVAERLGLGVGQAARAGDLLVPAYEARECSVLERLFSPVIPARTCGRTHRRTRPPTARRASRAALPRLRARSPRLSTLISTSKRCRWPPASSRHLIRRSKVILWKPRVVANRRRNAPRSHFHPPGDAPGMVRRLRPALRFDARGLTMKFSQLLLQIQVAGPSGGAVDSP